MLLQVAKSTSCTWLTFSVHLLSLQLHSHLKSIYAGSAKIFCALSLCMSARLGQICCVTSLQAPGPFSKANKYKKEMVTDGQLQ